MPGGLARDPRLGAWRAFVEGAFLVLGWEHVRMLPDDNPLLTFQFYDFPITHSLVGALAWSLAAPDGAEIAYAIPAGLRITTPSSGLPSAPPLLDVVSGVCDGIPR